METKEHILQKVNELVAAGELTKDELNQAIQANIDSASQPSREVDNSLVRKFMGAMFLAAGVIMFIALQFGLALAFNANQIASAVANFVFAIWLWGVVYAVRRHSNANNYMLGVSMAMFLVGSLALLSVPVYVASGAALQLGALGSAPGLGNTDIILAIGFFTVALMSVGYYRLSKNRLSLSVGALALWLSFCAVVLAVLARTNPVNMLPYQFATISLGVMLPVCARMMDYYTKYNLHKGAFAFFGGLIVLVSMYAYTWSEYDILWYIGLVAAIVGAFCWGVARRARSLFLLASVTTVVVSVTFSSRYFSGDSIVLSLFISSIMVLLCATGLVGLHKRYFSAGK